MPSQTLSIYPIPAPVQSTAFDLQKVIHESITAAGHRLEEGDVLAISSKYAAISAGRVVCLQDITPTAKAERIAARYNMDASLVQLVIEGSEKIFGGIQLGFLLTYTHGIVSPNAGLDRSNIPDGHVVLFPANPYRMAHELCIALKAYYNIAIGLILTDSWLVPGRLGTTGVALAVAGFEPLQDERGKPDLFGNPLKVTQISIADTLCVCAQSVMGERDQATPLAIVRGADIQLTDRPISVQDVAIPWEMDIYVESLTTGRLPSDF